MGFVQSLFRRGTAEKRLDAELQFHFDELVREHLDAGIDDREARRRARLEFGRLALVKEECREQQRLSWAHDLASDVRYGVRSLLQAPVLCITALLSLAVGIGANTAVFAVVKSFVLNPLPYAHSERIVSVYEWNRTRGHQEFTSPAGFADWREQNQSFDAIAAVQWSWPANIVGSGGDPVRVGGQRVTSEFFKTLSASAVRGRTLTPQDYFAQSPRTMVISYPLWQGLFGGDPQIVGREIKLDDEPTTVIGVMPPDFRLFHSDVKFWVPFKTDFLGRVGGGGRDSRWLYVVARLSPGVSVQQAQADLDVIANRIGRQHPADQRDRGSLVEPLTKMLVPEYKRAALWVLFGVVGSVLLAACVNVANLLLGRSSARSREIAVRVALGASRARLIRQLLTESGLLGLCGAALGAGVALLSLRLLAPVVPQDLLPPTGDLTMDLGVLTFTGVVGIVTTLLFGLTPAWQSSAVGLATAVNSGGRFAGGRRRTGLRQILVVAQTALALVVLVGAGLMIHSLMRLNRVDFGGNPDNLVMMQTLLPRYQYTENVIVEGVSRDMRAVKPEHGAFHRHIVSRLENLPGIEAAGITDVLPITPPGSWILPRTVGTAKQPFDPNADDAPQAIYRPVSKGYFEAMGLELVVGRLFDKRDTRPSDRVAIVNETMARTHWPDESPIGEHLTFHSYVDRSESPRRIVGVVKDIRQWMLGAPQSEAYVPYLQQPAEYPGYRWQDRQRVSFAIRSQLQRANLVRAVHGAIREFDPELPLYDVYNIDEVRDSFTASTRFYVWLLIAFAVVVLVLAVGGAYSVTSYLVDFRRREVGIRMALGAKRDQVLKLIVRQGLLLASVGAAVGIGVAVGLSRFFESMLFEVEPIDPLTFGSVALLVLIGALAANYFPARRASQIEPMAALRHD